MKLFRKIVSHFQKTIPASCPVKVRRIRIKGMDGYCQKWDNHYFIAIDREISEARAIDTLIHEWAHARSWNHLMDSMTDAEFHARCHDSHWGVAYAEVYRCYELFIAENKFSAKT